ncbi:hypothetical protein [Cytophaga hutchinsonii]|uniref:Uncharacterized protein n=1 Tax=Cytophaga hutchinsonii (strain ATCC 33406 / DSM 1761 / CIP 103989 / NBRC 15051 / NCIMB 9469 / D465) TaxID=269798 RepID=A0A6N4SPW4_CYTH3|nr:hypothetical protein [Cytophaga hutchinsonii]ABG58342.1 hypothetical protein CHU_1065 [Cytophaga hutchinsonii ATCC 33406]SFX52157.1 hypothetical protein SAMN04487930_10588 [Cytophaga hutchinsonii ATCC 33406]
MVRFFTLLFSLFVLALSIVPCSDTDHCCKEPVEMSSEQEKHIICTPFCTGCASVSTVSAGIHIPAEFHDIRTPWPVSLYQSVFISAYFYSFWQPPKLHS